MSIKAPPWKQFEKAVANFLVAMGDGAKVTYDTRLPDKHTNHPRQRDVWVEWPIMGGRFSVKALVSCKALQRQLDQQDIDHFNGEFISSGAQIGIIYSKVGFNDRALDKAHTLGFHCCRLYDDEPADIPESISLGSAYCFRPRFQFSVTGEFSAYKFTNWGQVTNLRTSNGTVMQHLVEAINAYQFQDDSQGERWRRAIYGSRIEIEGFNEGLPKLTIKLEIADQVFRAKTEWYLLNGSYSVTDKSFRGSQATPSLDMNGIHPGPGWEEVAEIPDQMPKPCIAMFMQMDARARLVEYGETAFPSKAIT